MEHQICYLIDDDSDEQDFFLEALADLNNGVELIYGNDSRFAVKKLKRGNFAPDYIFIDVNMPGMNGWELLAEIRTLPYLQDIPIMIYSTSSQEEKAKQNGATGFMQKKSSITELRETLRIFFDKYRKTE